MFALTLLAAAMAEGLDYAVRRQAKHSSMDALAAAGPADPLHAPPTDEDTSAKVAAESMA